MKSEMQTKGFQYATPNFNTADLSDSFDVSSIASDIVTEPAVKVDFLQHLYGPWLVMTDDLQGELFVDHDHFVYYRPANGLGYGIGTIKILDAGETGTAFVCNIETYSYQQTDAVVPQYGLSFDVTGMVKKVSSKSSDYTTFSLVGVWRRINRNNANANLLPLQKDPSMSTNRSSESSADAHDASCSPDTEVLSSNSANSGDFNAAKLSPWDRSTAPPPFQPSQQLQSVFAQVFPEHLNATSHRQRAVVDAKKHEPTTTSQRKKSGPVHLDLAPYAVGSIPGLYYIPDYISELEEQKMLSFIRNTPEELKSKLTKRVCQEWGCTMCQQCQKSFVSDANMPPWVQEAVDMQVYDGLYTPTTFPNSVRIHEYEKGDGIGPHCDGPIYVPMVTVLSLASTCVMNFYPRASLYNDHPMDHYNDTFKFGDGEIGQKCPLQSVVLEPRSLLIFSGEGYYYYPHGVSDKAEDSLDESVAGRVVNRHLLREKDIQTVPRSYRASITTRNLMTRCNHDPARAEYAMKRAWYVYNQEEIPSQLFTPAPVLAASAVVTPSSATATSSKQSSVSADTFSVEQQLRDVRAEQHELRKTVEELRQLVLLSVPAQTSFQKDSAVILNHLSTTVLEMDCKLDDILEKLESGNTDNQ